MRHRGRLSRIPGLSRFAAAKGLELKIADGVATIGGLAVAPGEAMDALVAGAWIPVRVGLVTAPDRLTVTVDDPSPPSHEAYSFELAPGAVLRFRSSAHAQPQYPRESGVREAPAFGDADDLDGEDLSAEREESRAELVHRLSARLSLVESQFDAEPELAAGAREVAEHLATTLDRLERAMGRRLVAERRLAETHGAWGPVLAELRASLARAQQTEDAASETFSSAVESARDVLGARSRRT